MFKNLFRNIRKKEEREGNSENILKEKQTQSKSLNEDNEAGNYESEVDGNISSKEDTGNIGIIVKEKQLEKRLIKKRVMLKPKNLLSIRFFTVINLETARI